jgi:lipoyl(octanoyl) transferase
MTVPCNVVRLGVVDYMETMELQNRLAREVEEERSDGWLLFLEHPHTYTFGRQGNEENLLLTPEELDERGAKVYWVDRGGDVIYHGPGQLVCYTILDLKRWDTGARWYVRALEMALLETLSALGVKAEIVEGRPGVWVGQNKIAAIGLHITHGVTTHGFALNVDPDLDYFRHIVSCGLTDTGDTSVGGVLGHHVGIEEAIDAVLPALVKHLDIELREGSVEEMTAALSAS